MKLSHFSAAAFSILYFHFAVILGAMPNESHAQGFQIDSGVSGSWYDRAKAGQGFTIAILSSDSALLTWFTYDQNGNQLWMQGVGSIQGNQMVFEQLLRFEGLKFGPDMNPGDRIDIPSGSMTISFSSCGAGVAQYSGTDILPSDTLNIERLSVVASFSCDQFVAPQLTGVFHKGLSGAWYEPASAGQGWQIEVLSDDLALIYWFTYDQQGRQRWMIGIGQINVNGVFVEEMLRPIGGRFGPAFDPDEVVHTHWGAFAISHVGCQRAVAAYGAAASDGFGSFREVVPLAMINGADPCGFPQGLSSISGELAATSGSTVDGTTNDPNSILIPNDTPAQAQEAGNPVVITGFAAASPVGFGRYASQTDEFDEYRLPLIAGQSLQLIIADWDPDNPTRNDLDLWLYRSGENEPVATAMGIGRNEFIAISETGFYDVVVQAFNGASVYTLSASYAPVPATAQSFDLMADFEPGEILVGFRRPIDKHGENHWEIPQRAAQDQGLELLESGLIGSALLGLAQDTIEQPASANAVPFSHTGSAIPGKLAQAASRPDLSIRLQTIGAVKALLAREDVHYAHPNYRMHALSNDPRRAEQWHYDSISLPAAWDISRGDANVLVAVIDSGIGPHPDIAANVRYDLGLDAVSLINNITSDRPGDDPIDSFTTQVRESHGTHVAGTVAALAGNARDGVGVAPDVSVMPVRVLGANGSGSIFAIQRAIYWAAGHSEYESIPDPVRHADVINLSLGGFGACPPGIQAAIDFARNKGIIVVAAAGNDTSSLNVMPAGCEGVVSVAATNRFNQPAYYSNCGNHVSVAAPGGEVSSSADTLANGPSGSMPRYRPQSASSCRTNPQTISSFVDGVFSLNYEISPTRRLPLFNPYHGTSMAAPHVAGVAALMKSVNPDLTPQAFDALLSAGSLTDRVGSAAWDPEYGYGVINARKAVQAALGSGQATPGSILGNPASLSFGDVAQTRTLRIEPAGSNVGSLEGFFQNESPWLVSALSLEVGADGFGLYQIGIDRSGLVPGLHVGTLIARSTNGIEARIPVDMRVEAMDQIGEAGFLYLALFDANTGVLVDLLGGSGFEGRYHYEINGLVAGAYLLLAFSDVGYRGYVCNDGDLCGYYPGSGPLQALVLGSGIDLEIQQINVEPDVTGIGETGPSQLSMLSNDSEHNLIALGHFASRSIQARLSDLDLMDRRAHADTSDGRMIKLGRN
jgi:serine protease